YRAARRSGDLKRVVSLLASPRLLDADEFRRRGYPRLVVVVSSVMMPSRSWDTRSALSFSKNAMHDRKGSMLMSSPFAYPRVVVVSSVMMSSWSWDTRSV